MTENKIIHTIVFFILLLIVMPFNALSQSDQTIYKTVDEDNNRLVFIGQGELLDEQVGQTGTSNSIIFINEALQIPLFFIRQAGDLNRAMVVQFPVEKTEGDSTSTKNRVEITQRGKGNSATVIQNE